MALAVPLSCLLALLVAGLAQGIRGQDPGPRPLELKEVFTLFQIQYNRSYSSPAEHARRLGIFAHNLAQAQELQEKDLGTAEFGVTPFSDLTDEEFGQLYRGQKAAGRAPNVDRKVGSDERAESVPPTCDWRKAQDVIFPVRDQKNCNCCWAMAAAGNIEAQWSIKFKKPVEVSVQEILDCDRCKSGCSGGYVWDAFLAVLNNSGLASEKDYPFRGEARTYKCLAKKYKKVAWIQDFIMLSPNEQGIARYVATEGPITVTINSELLKDYKKGVIKPKPGTCDPWKVDHVVLLVGFGNSKSVERRPAEPASSQSKRRHPRSNPYWILKNSWGPKWGEEGYFRLHRGSKACGITKFPLTARVNLDKKQHVVTCPR
ncbi:cathepsin W [Pteronotus mesoamericanus]|uniref:cathepsin W n=1 Tax=Pteronotus mesoamericanus TaxID=1884717 RepID=UPI0023EA97BE|nr:cathepsin W [Pteronotus parnellii mesoamericanus]